jgi:ATP-binding cassette, subfamily B (MDR/TAP), member 1
MTIIFGNLTNVFGGFGSPGSTTVTKVSNVSDFNSLVTKFALQFVYLGIGVLVSSFLGMFFWTLSGERISRRIRGYRQSRGKFDSRLYLQAVLRQNVAFFDRIGAGEITNRISNDAELLREGISDKVETFLL